ncbi:unnamed protein product, partial [Urochloa humidicola]
PVSHIGLPPSPDPYCSIYLPLLSDSEVVEAVRRCRRGLRRTGSACGGSWSSTDSDTGLRGACGPGAG